jgi:hypothetical protein
MLDGQRRTPQMGDRRNADLLAHMWGPTPVVIFADVLHQAEAPMILLREAVRVRRKALIIKDHTRS